jgi:hypothetical protein
VDGDPVNAAEFAQGYKVSVDKLAFVLQILGGTRTIPNLLIDGIGGNPNVLTVRPKHIVITATSGFSSNFTAGAGAGTSPTLGATGSDGAFQVVLTTGSTPSVSSSIFAMIYVGAFHTAPLLIFSPGNAAAAALSGTSAVFPASSSGSGFTFESGSTALSASTQYIWNFFAIDALNVNP